MRERAGILGLVLLAVACGGSGDASPAPAPAASADPPAAPPALADRVQVDQMEILQGTTVLLAKESAVVALDKRNAPVIANRPGLVRVHATKLDRAKLPALVAQLRIHRPGQDDLLVDDSKRSVVPYDGGDLQTTWNFEVGADVVAPGVSLEVTLRDPAGKDAEDTVVFPPLDQPAVALSPKTTATTLRVRFVPIKYNGDQSGRLPTLDARTVEQYKQSLYKMYPASSVEVDVREPLPWGAVIKGNGDGWDELLTTMMSVRRAEYAPDDVYYIGVFEAADSLETFCSHGGCVLGIAPQAGVMDTGMHVALITGYGGTGRNGTLAQELAHAMGRGHADCGDPQWPDPDYPYANARLGVAGYDIIEKTLFSPDSGTHDFMSYCSPVWVSDYTWSGIAQRMTDTADGMTKDHLGARTAGLARAITVDAQGNLKLGPQIDVRGGGEGDVTVHYEDASGASLGTARASFRPYDNIPGGILVGPEPPANAKVVRVPRLSARPLQLPLRPGVATTR